MPTAKPPATERRCRCHKLWCVSQLPRFGMKRWLLIVAWLGRYFLKSLRGIGGGDEAAYCSEFVRRPVRWRVKPCNLCDRVHAPLHTVLRRRSLVAAGPGTVAGAARALAGAAAGGARAR